ncbi:hypothetical protein HRbin36_02550 [bacterium HR36]|nr:hypothetical protein HRbin36_02550 [bacterium HR36]
MPAAVLLLKFFALAAQSSFCQPGPFRLAMRQSRLPGDPGQPQTGKHSRRGNQRSHRGPPLDPLPRAIPPRRRGGDDRLTRQPAFQIVRQGFS